MVEPSRRAARAGQRTLAKTQRIALPHSQQLSRVTQMLSRRAVAFRDPPPRFSREMVYHGHCGREQNDGGNADPERGRGIVHRQLLKPLLRLGGEGPLVGCRWMVSGRKRAIGREGMIWPCA